MFVKEETALHLAEKLLQIKAIRVNTRTPFTWASGWKSPIYCDNRITLSYPAIRTYIRQQFVKLIRDEFGDIDLIAGVATGGIAHGVLVAQDMGLPFAYIRNAEKGHGLLNKIEGVIKSGQSLIVVEDLISTGGSSLQAVEAIRENGGNVKGLVAIFTYGFDEAVEKFKEANCPVYALCDYQHLIVQALKDDYVREQEMNVLTAWRTNPSKWVP